MAVVESELPVAGLKVAAVVLGTCDLADGVGHNAALCACPASRERKKNEDGERRGHFCGQNVKGSRASVDPVTLR